MLIRKIQCTTIVAALIIASAGYSYAADTSSIKADVLQDVSDQTIDDAMEEFESILKQQNKEQKTLNASNASSTSGSAAKGKAEISKDSGYYKSEDAFFAGVKKPERVFKNID